MTYQFTSNWMAKHKKYWDTIIQEYKPKNIIEIGSNEGRSTVYWASQPTTKHVWCIDNWKNEYESKEAMFDANISKCTNITKIKENSIIGLALLQKDLQCSIDLIYIDGDHDSRTVLSDAVLSFNLCRPGGIIIFDDYLLLRSLQRDNPGVKITESHPKIGIDAFTNIFQHDIDILSCNYQLILKKL